MPDSVARVLEPVVRSFLPGSLPVTIRCWDGSQLGPEDAPAALIVRSPDAIRRLLYAPNELGLGRAYVAGELDIEGDVYRALTLRDAAADEDGEIRLNLGRRAWLAALRAARQVGVLGRPLPPPAEEARLRGRLHSKWRDAEAVSHHYDMGNEFYRLLLGETLTYSCAYFDRPNGDLDDAQRAKYDLICRKLGLRPGMRLLDVGCGWGGMVIHAAQHYRVEAVGVTVSQAQCDLAAKRVAEAGLEGRAEIRLSDYRDVVDGPYDAISSIGMFEHVGTARLGAYFATLFHQLRPEGRLLNHAISRPAGPAPFDRNSFIGRYVFPDGEIHEVGTVVTAMQQHDFEIRDVESLREHYALTLRAWSANLERHWAECVALAGEARARIWRIYIAGCALNFEAGRTSIHQVLGVKSADRGRSGMPLRRDWVV